MKIEYLVVAENEFEGLKANLIKSEKIGKDSQSIELLNILGSDYWELVSVASSERTTYPIFYFKRQGVESFKCTVAEYEEFLDQARKYAGKYQTKFWSKKNDKT